MSHVDDEAVDGGGARTPKAEALRELATLADGAADGICAVLTQNGAAEMRKLAARLWGRFAQESQRPAAGERQR